MGKNLKENKEKVQEMIKNKVPLNKFIKAEDVSSHSFFIITNIFIYYRSNFCSRRRTIYLLRLFKIKIITTKS